ncbi:NADH dehydrogenase subunit 2 (mitochondrion) [Pyxicephalus adspersus]|uniref:NADH-ubiquinone oxidoreductase chain 2 n=1 Tax=Pyxicephalus adspersus TaxID=30357 RepID=A0A5B8GTH7_PYXAD|nr:NADH dehydrogenase subunit 2 [Pyxicephalus adspersus]QDW76100.1 NADH dehydrogenase subunit 2 [Pyxicephalus adspersus]
MNPLTLLTILFSLLLGTTITLLSSHWLLAWIGLEINTLAIIPLMTKTPHPRSIEAATKYFLTQATASSIILFSSFINAWNQGEWDMTSLADPQATILSIALMMKLGLAPLHFWMPEVMQGIPLLTGLILSTWQKIAPMSLILQMSDHINIYVITTIGLTSILIGGWGGIAQTQLRKIMAFSSIGHLGWMMLILKFSPQLTAFNFIWYVTMTAAMFFSLMSLHATKLTEISTSWPKTPTLALTSMLTLLSLAGLPPLTGFAPKLLIALELMKQNAILLTTVIMAASLLALFFYLRLTYSMALTLPPNTSNSLLSWRLATKMTPLVALMNILALMALSLSPSILILL